MNLCIIQSPTHLWSLVIKIFKYYYFLVAIYTPRVATAKPITSKLFNTSFKNSQAITAVVGGIKKNIATVLLAELFLIKNINIVNAPKETKNIW